MKLEEFVQAIQLGLPKFTEKTREDMRADGWEEAPEESWWDLYSDFVEEYGVRGKEK